MSDPRLLQDDSPDIAAQVRAATANSAYVPENEYDNAEPGPSRPMTGLLGTSDAEIAAKLQASSQKYAVERYAGAGRVPGALVGYGAISDYEIRHDALKLAINFEGVSDDEIIDIATTFEAYLRGETQIEQTVPGSGGEGTAGEGTGG